MKPRLAVRIDEDEADPKRAQTWQMGWKASFYTTENMKMITEATYEMIAGYILFPGLIIITLWYLENARRTIWWFLNDTVALIDESEYASNYRRDHGFLRKYYPGGSYYGMVATTILYLCFAIVLAFFSLMWPAIVFIGIFGAIGGILYGIRTLIRMNKRAPSKVVPQNEDERDELSEMIREVVNEELSKTFDKM